MSIPTVGQTSSPLPINPDVSIPTAGQTTSPLPILASSSDLSSPALAHLYLRWWAKLAHLYLSWPLQIELQECKTTWTDGFNPIWKFWCVKSMVHTLMHTHLSFQLSVKGFWNVGRTKIKTAKVFTAEGDWILGLHKNASLLICSAQLNNIWTKWQNIKLLLLMLVLQEGFDKTKHMIIITQHTYQLSIPCMLEVEKNKIKTERIFYVSWDGIITAH